jgi:two-component system, OmpR family, response regulator
MKHILIVEDDHDLAELWRLAIERMGEPIQTEDKRDGRSAMDRVSEPPPPDVIILDMHLPIVHGRKIYQYVRSAKHLRNSRVVIITADRELADELNEQARDGTIVPPDGLIVKPVLVKDFQTLIKRMLD